MQPLSQSPATSLVLDRARIVRGQQTLLNEISFSLQAGEILAILGANGAGKSTLLAALAGEATLTSGTAFLNNTPLTRFNPASLAATRAFNATEPPLAFSLTVFEYVSLGKPFADVHVNAISQALTTCHAQQWSQRDAASLSSGELLRVQLARSLYQLGDVTHRLWLLDEPLAHLDLAQRQFVLQLLRDIATTRQWCIVFSTHEPRDAQRIADHVLMLKRGENVGYGALKDTLTNTLLTCCFEVAVEI